MEEPQLNTTDSSTSGTKRILMLGGTGTIGRATVAELVKRGHQVVCIARPKAGSGGKLTQDKTTNLLKGAEDVFFSDIKGCVLFLRIF